MQVTAALGDIGLNSNTPLPAQDIRSAMATNSFVEIDIPEAAELADLAGIHYDFETTLRFASLLKNALKATPPTYELVEPLTTATLVWYNRPFAKGVRRRINAQELKSLSPGQRAAHDAFRNWRDKYISHSVNLFEENAVQARFWVERFEEEGFTSISFGTNRILGMSLEDIHNIIDLCSHFQALIKPQLESEQTKVLDAVRSLPREQVMRMAKPPKFAEMKDVAKARKQKETRRT